jgi:hypothetical protein
MIMRAFSMVPVAAALLLGAATASADTTLASGLPTNVQVSMRGDAIAWSAPADNGRWKLVIARHGIAADAAVRTGRVPFDVDLGDDGHGHLIATYSRCSRIPRGLERPRGCDVYRYDVTALRERRVPGLGIGSASDYLPTAASGRIAFARSVAGGPARLYVRSLSGGPLRRLHGGLSNTDDRTGPRSLDLGRRGLAIAWILRGPAKSGRDIFDYGAQEVRFDPLHGATRLLARYAQGNLAGTDVVGVTATDTGVLWGAQGNGESQKTMLYLIPQLTQSSDSRELTFPIASVSGVSLDHMVVLTQAGSVVLLEPGGSS